MFAGIWAFVKSRKKRSFNSEFNEDKWDSRWTLWFRNLQGDKKISADPILLGTSRTPHNPNPRWMTQGMGYEAWGVMGLGRYTKNRTQKFQKKNQEKKTKYSCYWCRHRIISIHNLWKKSVNVSDMPLFCIQKKLYISVYFLAPLLNCLPPQFFQSSFHFLLRLQMFKHERQQSSVFTICFNWFSRMSTKA